MKETLISSIDQRLLLDSAIIRKQCVILQDDSTAAVYIINQLELSENTGYLILENLKRHCILDSTTYTIARSNMKTQNFVKNYL
ncbi:hypothetical protein [Reichenbachiella versicolor]|uniref:hypothetical protein n=1 Tax=Reichenbachiella versicolor TaxID=1821036 RepID=UPI001C86F3E1|nr:hypothetical protein [Reichenbachiella versicolor]